MSAQIIPFARHAARGRKLQPEPQAVATDEFYEEIHRLDRLVYVAALQMEKVMAMYEAATRK